MGMRIGRFLCTAMVAVALASATARAQSCNDGNECTNPDMCADGTCSGTTVPGACDDGNPCTIEDTCVSGVCQGTPAMGASCGMTGCEGTCGPNGICLPDAAKQGQPCTDGLGECTTNDVCTGILCFGSIVQCPDSDDNKCTPEVCNPQNGQCITIPVVSCGECATCDTETGCVPSNEGGACDDFDVCTGAGTCQNGSCLAGAPVTPTTPSATDTVTPTQTDTPPTDTPTETPSAPTATQTAPPTDTATIPTTDTPTAGVATPTDTPTLAIATPTDTPESAPTDTPTGVPTGTTTATATATGLPTGTATATATLTPTGLPTGTATATVTFTPTGLPTGTATATVTPTGVPTGTATATVTPTGLPTGTATATATATATVTTTPTEAATRTDTPTVPPPATSTATATRTPLPVMASIIVGSATGEPGTSVTFDTSLETSSTEIAGAQVDIAFDARAPIAAKEDGKPDCAVNPAIEKEATTFAFQPSGCTPGEDCTGIRAIVLALDNLDPIADGATLFTCTVALAADASGAYPLTCSNAGAGDVEGNRVGADCTDGTITAAVPTRATIVIADLVGSAGTDVPMSVSLETEVDVAGAQNDVTFPAGVGVVAKTNGKPECAVNEAIEKGGTSFAYLPNGCTPGDTCTGVRALVLALDNIDPIPSGSVLYTCEVAIGPDVEDGDYPLVCTNAGASDPDGNAVATACDDANLSVGIQEITFTPTVTPTVTPTATTPPLGTPTVTPTPTTTATASATPTRTRKPKRDEDDGCQVVAPTESGAAWLLLLPVAALLWRRRR